MGIAATRIERDGGALKAYPHMTRLPVHIIDLNAALDTTVTCPAQAGPRNRDSPRVRTWASGEFRQERKRAEPGMART